MRSFHSIFLSGNLWQLVRQTTNRYVEGVFSLGTSKIIVGSLLQRSSRRKTQTCVYSPCKTPHMRSLSSKRRFLKRCPLTYQSTK